MGFSTYTEYTRSDHWRNFKAEYYKTRKKKCGRCGKTKNIQLHHKTYARIGKELPEDVIPLCGRCHGMTHRFVSAGVPLGGAHMLVERKRKKSRRYSYGEVVCWTVDARVRGKSNCEPEQDRKFIVEAKERMPPEGVQSAWHQQYGQKWKLLSFVRIVRSGTD